MSLSRRNFLRGGLAGLGVAAAAGALSPLIKVKKARAGTNGQRVIIVGIGGGLRMRESLGMAEGATMKNLFGTTPLVTGFGVSGSQPDPIIAPEYQLTARPLALPAARSVPLHTEGTLITNLRYADGPPGHLQGHGCLLSGMYNQIENRADARLPAPTIFELHRQQTNMPASDAWYVSQVGGFYRALITSGNAGYGSQYAGVYLQPPGVMQPLVPIITSGKRDLTLTGAGQLPIIPHDLAEDAAVARMTGVLDGNSKPFSPLDANVHLSAADNAAIQGHLAEIYSDSSYDKFFADSFGIGFQNGAEVDGTADAITVFHAERVLEKFRPSVMAITLLDVDTCHADFNGYLRMQQLADACVNHLWNFIQSIPELRDTTTMIVLPEHGRHNDMNGNNEDTLGRSGIDHGLGDDSDRNVWMLALGPNIAKNRVIAPTGITQDGRTSGRYETIDAVMTAMSVLGHDQRMTTELEAIDERPGLVIGQVMA